MKLITTASQIAGYKRVIQAVIDGTVDPSKQAPLAGSCLYDNTVNGVPNFCAVGCLFTDAQRDFIKLHRLNRESSIGTLVVSIGLKNINAVTGLPVGSLEALQRLHDGLASGMFAYGISTEATAAAKTSLIAYCELQITKLERKLQRRRALRAGEDPIVAQVQRTGQLPG